MQKGDFAQKAPYYLRTGSLYKVLNRLNQTTPNTKTAEQNEEPVFKNGKQDQIWNDYLSH
jgi:hypothetical protein